MSQHTKHLSWHSTRKAVDYFFVFNIIRSTKFIDKEARYASLFKWASKRTPVMVLMLSFLIRDPPAPNFSRLCSSSVVKVAIKVAMLEDGLTSELEDNVLCLARSGDLFFGSDIIFWNTFSKNCIANNHFLFIIFMNFRFDV